ncbi:MAG: glycogen/starch/alpha-glucan phosphorylase [Spirochaetia bacterium]|nr:glycogen/starch/alpha-glucan phosphorylase [Spirochaetia bacterium]
MDPTHIRMGNEVESIKWDYAEHLKYSIGSDRYSATDHDRFMALAYTVRDRIMHQWTHTLQTHHDRHVKRIYYLSLEFLMGRAMTNNVINLGLEKEVRTALNELGYTYEEIIEHEVDAGIGNGGLGRLAACFLDSMATMDLPAYGYGLRYNYGIFRQKIELGYQVEQPDNWLRHGNPWEIERRDLTFQVNFGGHTETITEHGRTYYKWLDTNQVIGVAYDMPIVGFGGKTVNTLRLWSAKAAEDFNFQDFNEGDYVEAVKSKVMAENLTQVLYPNDNLYLGKELRLQQQYFFVACSLADIIRRFRKTGKSWMQFPDYAAIQMNDTHPSLAVPELMRILIDDEGLSWEQAWDVTVRTLGYTNHTLMPEALEKWPVEMLERNLPRHLQIIFEINQRFLQKAITFFPGDHATLRKISIIEEGFTKEVRMANLCIVGSHSTNGVAALHTQLLKSTMFPELASIFPERFNNKTNGITQRRWLLSSNPPLAELITRTIGSSWITDFSSLTALKPHAEDPAFLEAFDTVKLTAKKEAANYLKAEFGWEIDPYSIFDVQVKRIHEYKRQLLNALHIVMIYNRLKDGIPEDFTPITFLFGGKAAPGYMMAKLIIKLINNISQVINSDQAIGGALKVYFMPNYRVSMAEKIIPATDISEQISTAGTEASGTGNMKFMCNGALTIGTLDGANIEIVEEAGEENEFIFGHTAEEVSALRSSYEPYDWCFRDAEIKRAVDLITTGFFNFAEPGIFEPLRKMLFDEGDRYMHFADLASYDKAHSAAMELYKDRAAWNRKAVLNIAASGKFSSDRTIGEYNDQIWRVKPCPISEPAAYDAVLDEAKKYTK